MHAAGVVICQKPVDEYVPLSRAADGTITTQFIMTTLEELGLLKMDFLGLRTLTVIQNAVQLARKSSRIFRSTRLTTMIRQCWIISVQERRKESSSWKVAG